MGDQIILTSLPTPKIKILKGSQWKKRREEKTGHKNEYYFLQSLPQIWKVPPLITPFIPSLSLPLYLSLWSTSSSISKWNLLFKITHNGFRGSSHTICIFLFSVLFFIYILIN